MDIDLHIHTNRYSGCSNIDPVKLLKKAKAVGLDGIALTEHGIRWGDEQIEQLRRASGVGDLLIIPGQEVACYWRHGRFQGEFLVFGYPKSLGSSRSAEEVIELVHAKGGVVIAAHPFKKFRHGDEGFYGAGKQLYDFRVDGLEVEHPDYDAEARAQAAEAMTAMGIAGTGASDSHALHTVGICRTVFERPVNGVAGLCEEIRAGRLKALNLTNGRGVPVRPSGSGEPSACEARAAALPPL
mgnify:CR=1 FL=1